MANKNLFKAGDYFTATYDGQRIRGLVGGRLYGQFNLFNKSVGVEDCSGSEGYGRILRLRGNKQPDLDAVGVTNFKVCTDARQIGVIKYDSLPKVEGYGVCRTDGQNVKFGCGALELSVDEIETFVKVRKQIDKLVSSKEKELYDSFNEDIEHGRNDSLDDVSIEELQAAIKVKNAESKVFATEAGKKFKDIAQQIEDADNLKYNEVDLKVAEELLKKLKKK